MGACIKCGVDLLPGSVYCHMCGKKQITSDRKHTRRGNGTGTVYKRGDKWVAEVTKGFKQDPNDSSRHIRVVERKCGIRTKKEALEYLPILKGQQKKKKRLTWSQLYEAWLPTHRAGKSTIDCYKAASKYFSDLYFSPVEDIEIDDLQECLDSCPKGKRTKQNMKALCGLMYKYAVPRGYATLNLAPYLIVDGESGSSRSGFNADQLDKIRRAVGVIPYADYIYCMCYLGFRPSEFLALDIKDYDRKQKTLTGGSKTDAGKNRVVTISPKIQPIIDRLACSKISGALFCDDSGAAWKYDRFRDTAFYPVLEQIGIENPIEEGKHKYSPHSCRHTFATLMKNVQAAEKDKMRLIGHASPEMLRYYQDVNISDLRLITDAI